jgi:hypothetical protein
VLAVFKKREREVAVICFFSNSTSQLITITVYLLLLNASTLGPALQAYDNQ